MACRNKPKQLYIAVAILFFRFLVGVHQQNTSDHSSSKLRFISKRAMLWVNEPCMNKHYSTFWFMVQQLNRDSVMRKREHLH